jgi:hypothetical protein
MKRIFTALGWLVLTGIVLLALFPTVFDRRRNQIMILQDARRR